jgi:hypothetical protein
MSRIYLEYIDTSSNTGNPYVVRRSYLVREYKTSRSIFDGELCVFNMLQRWKLP